MNFFSTKVVFFIFFFLTIIIYGLSYHGEGAHFNYFILLADAFLHGRLDVLIHPSWLNELAFWNGKYYVVYPPMPGILLIPFVAIFGINFPQPYFSILIASFNVAISYLFFLKVFKRKVSIWLTILYGFGTIHWYHAEVGSSWYVAHMVGLLFLWLMLLEVFTKKRLFLIGLCLGGAYLSRLPMIFAIIFPLVFLRDLFFNFATKKINFRNLFFLGLGVLPAIVFNALYNFVRYGTFSDKSYVLLPVFNEPWYKYGLVSVRYIPTHLKEIFTALPVIVNHPPFVIPSLFAMAIWIITPAYLFIIFAKFRSKLVLASLLSLIAVAVPSLMHGGNGFTQFGYRHTLDYFPFILLLVGSGFRDKVSWWMIVLIILSIIINFWGVYMISFLNIWGW